MTTILEPDPTVLIPSSRPFLNTGHDPIAALDHLRVLVTNHNRISGEIMDNTPVAIPRGTRVFSPEFGWGSAIYGSLVLTVKFDNEPEEKTMALWQLYLPDGPIDLNSRSLQLPPDPKAVA